MTMSLDDIDFAERYRQHLRRSERPPKPASDWDKRGAAMGHSALGGAYAEAFVHRMNLDGARSLLDVGCGPGTICRASCRCSSAATKPDRARTRDSLTAGTATRAQSDRLDCSRT